MSRSQMRLKKCLETKGDIMEEEKIWDEDY